MPSNFSIRRPTGLLRRTPGELLIGGVTVARSHSFNVLLEALVGHLSALACTHRPVDEPRVRAFTNGTSVVLTDLLRPGLVDDRALARRGVSELHLWSPEFAEGPAIALPPALEQVTGVRQSRQWATLKIAGVVLSDASASLGVGYGWLHALGRMGTLAPPTTAADGAAARTAIVDLLSR